MAPLLIGVGIITVLVAGSALQPLLGLPSPNEQNLDSVLQPPSFEHPFGTDSLGRDVFSRTLAAARLDLGVAVAVTLVSLVIGTLLGAIAGFYGRWADSLVMRLSDGVLAFPFLVLVTAVIAVTGPGLTGVLIGVPIAGWALYARMTRAEMLVIRQEEYVLAAETLGLSKARVILRHALPNAWRPALVFSTADVVLNIVLLAALSYLGLGVQPPTAEWGGIIADGQDFLLQAWWISTLPGLVVVLAGVAFSLIGDGLADLLGEEIRFAA